MRNRRNTATHHHDEIAGTIAYVLTAYPRASEIFILSEIHRLEQASLRLRLFALKRAEQSDCFPRHPVVDRITAQPEFLPATTSLKSTTLLRWLAANISRFTDALLGVAGRHPLGFALAAAATFAQAMRARRTFWSSPRKKCFKEFLQAVALADKLDQAADVRHLHAHYCHGTTTVTWLAAMICGLSFSCTGHARDIYCEELNPAGLLKRKLAAARFAVTCTEANREHLQKLAGNTTVHRVYHGLNSDFTQLLTDHTPRPESNNRLRILGVGRLVAKKGFDVLIEACGILQRRQVPLEVLIVSSDGEHGEEIRRRIAALDLNRIVRITGTMDQIGLYREYRRASVFCLPCRVLDDGDRDGFPNVLAEAMACGLPVVTTAVSGIPELITDRINGLLVPTGDAETLADQLASLHLDAALAHRLSENGKRTMRERFDGDQSARQLATLFRQELATNEKHQQSELMAESAWRLNG